MVHVIIPLTKDKHLTGLSIDISMKEGEMLPCRSYEFRFPTEPEALAFALVYEARFRGAVKYINTFTMTVNVVHNPKLGCHTVAIRYTPKGHKADD